MTEVPPPPRPSKPTILIAAMARDRTIGRDGGMPWHLPADLKHFKRTTLGCPMVLGRRTWESFGGRPLPGRPHLLVSRSLAERAAATGHPPVDGATVFGDVETALTAAHDTAVASDAAAVFVIGGGTLYAQTLDRADAMILTEIDLDVAGDTRFPAFDPAAWHVETVGGAAAEILDDGTRRPAFAIRRYDRR